VVGKNKEGGGMIIQKVKGGDGLGLHITTGNWCGGWGGGGFGEGCGGGAGPSDMVKEVLIILAKQG